MIQNKKPVEVKKKAFCCQRKARINQQVAPNEIIPVAGVLSKQVDKRVEHILVTRLILDQTVHEFEMDGGAGTFIRQMARKLGIDASNIKMIGVTSDY